MAPEPFQLSGRSGNAWLLPVIGVAAAAASALVYAWVDVYSPFPGYTSLLLVLLLALGAVLPVAYAGRALKVRSVAQLRIAGVGTGVAALWFAWAFFAWVFTFKASGMQAPSAWFWLGHPAALWSFAATLAENGWYWFQTHQPRGFELWTYWTLEAVIMLVCGWLWGPIKVADRGFCEDCGGWMDPVAPIMLPDADGALVGSVRANGIASLRMVARALRPDGPWLRLRRQRCAACAKSVFQVDRLVVTQGNKKERRTSVEPVVPLSWQGESEIAEFARIERLLQGLESTGRTAAAPGNRGVTGNVQRPR